MNIPQRIFAFPKALWFRPRPAEHKVYYGSILLFVLTLASSPVSVHAQHSLSGFSLSDSTMGWFDNLVGRESTELITGTYNEIKRQSQTTHAFFKNKGWSTGAISYRGETFLDVQLIYDLKNDLVFVPGHDGKTTLPIRLNQDQVKWFRIADHTFVRFNGSIPARPAGFYDQVYKGKNLEFLIKRTKAGTVENGRFEFKEKNHHLIGLDGAYHKVTSRSALLKLFEEHKHQLRQYMKRNGIRQPGKASYDQLKGLAAFCNSLSL